MEGRRRSRNGPQQPEPAPGGLLAQILLAPDRDRCPGARPVVSSCEQDEREYLTEVERCARTRFALSRRGVWHGEWAELDPDRVGAGAAPPAGDLFGFSSRWHAAEPIVLHGAAREPLAEYAAEIESARDLHRALQEPGGLKRWLAARAPELDPPFTLQAAPRPLFDRERDLEKLAFASQAPSGRGRRVQDLWVKSGWLSTYAEDDSLRVRVSFGRERDDDASGDLLRQRLVAELATRLFPESALVSANPTIVPLLERLCGEPILLTQHIAYWNGLEGGALFHHDAFAEDADAAMGIGQRGVCYVQLAGATAWLALSIGALAVRVREFVELFDAGEVAWVEAQLFPSATDRARLRALLADDERTVGELALPGCGLLGALVNRGPEFSAFLADAGHAYRLEEGDAILLPNHGLTRTAMHSVFCAGEETAYGLSLAVRADRETVIEVVSQGDLSSEQPAPSAVAERDEDPIAGKRPRGGRAASRRPWRSRGGRRGTGDARPE